MSGSTIAVILLSILLIGLVARRLAKKKKLKTDSGLFSSEGNYSYEVSMVGGDAGSPAEVVTEHHQAIIGLSQQLEADLYAGKEAESHDPSCPWCPEDTDERPPVDVPLKAKPRKKKASKKKSSKKKSKKSPKRKK